MPTTRDAVGSACPVCGASGLAPTDQVFSLEDVLDRWKSETGARFSPTTAARYAGEQVRLHRCEACRLGVFLPIHVGSEDFYSAIANQDQDYYVEDRWEFRTALRDLARARPRHLLDVGCGSGAFLGLARNRLPDTARTGVDFNPAATAAARARGHDVLDASENDLAHVLEGPYDAITVFQVIEHLHDPRTFALQLRDRLAPGGSLIITVPNAAGPVRHFSAALTDIPPHHVTRWQAETLRALAETLGWPVARMATEPLPDYLWDAYLPVLCEKDLRAPSAVRRGLVRFLPRITAALRAARVRWLPGVPGLALYARLERPA